MNSRLIKISSALFVAILLLLSCDDPIADTPSASKNTHNKEGNILVELSYIMTTYIDYDMPPLTLSSIDMAYLNPSSDKQKITMQLYIMDI